MPSRFHTNDNTIIVDNYDNALHIIKQKLDDGDYLTSNDSSINMTYNRTTHRYKVFPSKDISISINENPRSKENFNTIRLLDISTSSDDFDRYIESQIALNKLNHNLSDADYKIEQESELRKKLIDSIVYLQSSRKNKKECAYFEFDTASISTNTGAANSALSGMSPNPVISFLLGMFIQSVPGADGTGIMYMIVYVILTLFIVGLMVGKTPEFMNMKIGPRDIMIAAFIFLIHPASILIPAVIAFTTGNAQSVLAVPAGKVTTTSGFTQALYEYTSAAANNGSDYLGTSANTPFWNWSTAIVMFLGRYPPIIMA